MAWKDDVYDVIRQTWEVNQIFTLTDVYKHEDEFSKIHPTNGYISEKIRQVLQNLRDDGVIEFVDNDGTYRRLK